MTAEILLTPDDLELASALQAANELTSGPFKLVNALVQLALPLSISTIAVILLLSTYIDWPDAKTAIKWSAFILWTVMPLTVAGTSALGWLKRRQARYDPTPLTLEVLDSGLVVRSEMRHGEVSWSGVARIESDGRRVFIHFAEGDVLVVADRNFGDLPRFEAFHQGIAAKWKERAVTAAPHSDQATRINVPLKNA